MFDHDEANRQDAERPGRSVRGACVGSLVEVEAFERGVAEVCGVVNAAHGVLVAMVAEALAAGWWNGWGIHSPEHWLSWQTGMAPARAKGMVRLAARRDDLPVTIAALDAGELALDAAVEVARSVPSAYEADACELAKVSMVRQLQRVLRRYGYDHDEHGAAAGAEGGGGDRHPGAGAPDRGAGPAGSVGDALADADPSGSEATSRTAEDGNGPTAGAAPADAGASSSGGVGGPAAGEGVGPAADSPAVDSEGAGDGERGADGQGDGGGAGGDGGGGDAGSAADGPASDPPDGRSVDPSGAAGARSWCPFEEERSVQMGVDERGWWIRGRLPADEGAVVERALRVAREDRFRALRTEQEEADARAGRPTGAPPTVTLADGLVAVAEASLAAGAAAHPGSDRYRIHVFVDASPTDDDPYGVASIGLGPPLPAALRSLLLCDCSLRPVFEVHGAAVSIGRVSRTIPERLRRVVEHRDGGCRVPGCGRTWGIEVHHIWHWEDDGPTDTDNLLCLCKAHHRQHHLKLLGIAGNADRPPGTDGAVVFRDHHGRPLVRAGTPIPAARTADGDAIGAARAAGVDPDPRAYVHPDGNHIPWDAITLNPARPPRPPRSPAGSPGNPLPGSRAGPPTSPAESPAGSPDRESPACSPPAPASSPASASSPGLAGPAGSAGPAGAGGAAGPPAPLPGAASPPGTSVTPPGSPSPAGPPAPQRGVASSGTSARSPGSAPSAEPSNPTGPGTDATAA